MAHPTTFDTNTITEGPNLGMGVVSHWVMSDYEIQGSNPYEPALVLHSFN